MVRDHLYKVKKYKVLLRIVKGCMQSEWNIKTYIKIQDHGYLLSREEGNNIQKVLFLEPGLDK